MRGRVTPEVRYALALLVSTLVGTGLLAAESLHAQSMMHGYMLWNICLAWIPLGLAWRLRTVLAHKLWSSWEALLVSVAWLAFLPNSFYMVSDFIHLNEVESDQILFTAVTFSSFIFTGVMLGLASLYLVHLEFLKRVSARAAASLAAAVLLISSFAIYIGRDLRWNTWDVLTNPLGLLFDLSERILHPSQYSQVAAVVLPFFVLLASMYATVWFGLGALPAKKPAK